MILDASAVLAILRREPGYEPLAEAVGKAELCRLSAATFVETSIVAMGQLGDAGGHLLDEFIRQVGIKIEPVSEEQAFLARRAWSEYGKGRHSARLNFGDCFSYALAKSLDEPLLFKGDDFSRTDVEAAIRL